VCERGHTCVRKDEEVRDFPWKIDHNKLVYMREREFEVRYYVAREGREPNFSINVQTASKLQSFASSHAGVLRDIQVQSPRVAASSRTTASLCPRGPLTRTAADVSAATVDTTSTPAPSLPRQPPARRRPRRHR
jgi:hypothetical protein